ncbi:ABC transporter ATP-binding protein [Hathewaya histolytica]|uniref:ABC transporter ATP-binding protein n=1 Tax=Hathewaya histolytica TaxID=1498 RepID=UPI003B66FBB7
MNVLEVNNLYKSFKRQEVLNNINFTIEENEVVGFVGPNGAGKSTLMKIMVGLITPTRGNVKVMGYYINADRERAMEKIGCTIETPYFYEYLTGRQNLNIIANMYKNLNKEDIMEAAEKVGISDSLDKKVKTYSLGMKQRLGLAQAIIMKPKLLVLDEPTNGLDPEGIVQFRNILNKINNDGCTIFIFSHILSEIQNICQKVLFINNGTIVKEDIISDKYKDYENYVVRCSNKENFLELLKKGDYIKSFYTNDEDIYFNIKKDYIKNIINESVTNNIDINFISEIKKNLEEEFFNVLKKGGN